MEMKEGVDLDVLRATLENSPSNKVKLAVVDLDGILRGKWIPKDKFLRQLPDVKHAFCDIIFGWDCADTDYENNDRVGLHHGHPDLLARADLSTFRQVPWEGMAAMFLADFREARGPFPKICPRTLLRRIEKEAIEMGMRPLFSLEYEWMTFQETSSSLRSKNFSSLTPLHPGTNGYSLERPTSHQTHLDELFDLLPQFGIPLDAFHCETGQGCFEASLRPDGALRAADKGVLFKSAVRDLAKRNQLVASFMAKWDENAPGMGGHIHQSLWDLEMKRNLFHADEGPRFESGQLGINLLLEHYLAGVLHCMPQLFPLYAPTINSFKRFRREEFAPVNASWGIDNRTTALRVILGEMKFVRLENRVPGSDANPYLAVAASLASGLYGIKKKMKLRDAGPLARVQGNAYELKGAWNFYRGQDEALEAMGRSELARELLGENFVNHFVQAREWEVGQFREAVTDWEKRRYLEII